MSSFTDGGPRRAGLQLCACNKQMDRLLSRTLLRANLGVNLHHANNQPGVEPQHESTRAANKCLEIAGFTKKVFNAKKKGPTLNFSFSCCTLTNSFFYIIGYQHRKKEEFTKELRVWNICQQTTLFSVKRNSSLYYKHVLPRLDMNTYRDFECYKYNLGNQQTVT